MIVANLNALREWQRVRESTEPEIPDVDRNPGTEDTDPPSLEEGSKGRVRRPAPRRRRRHGRKREDDRRPIGHWYHPRSKGRALPRAGERRLVGREGDEIFLEFENGLEERETDYLPERGLIADYQGQNVDVEG